MLKFWDDITKLFFFLTKTKNMSIIKDTRTVNIDIGYDIIIPVTINKDNGFLFTLAQDVGTDEPVNLVNLLPKVSESSLSLYVYLLEGKDTTNVYVVDRQTMIGCLAIYDFTSDIQFFNFLLKSLFNLWTVLSPVLYGNKVTNEVKWEIWLCCPYQLLPDSWQENTTFMRMWKSRQDNKHITVNGDEVFDFEHVTATTQAVDNNNLDEAEDENEGEGENEGETITTFVTRATSYNRQHDNTNISSNVIKEVNNGQLLSTINNITYNGKEQGQVIVEFGNDTTIYNVINDLENGPYRSYKGQQLTADSYKINGDTQGVKTYYYSNGRVNRTTPYKNNQFNGTETLYLNTAKLTPQMMTEWSHGDKIRTIHYYKDEDEEIDSDYVFNGKIYGLPVLYNFYTPDGVLTRRITNPLNNTADKYDVFYDDKENIIKEDEYDKTWKYNIRTRSWTQ
jgi:antitoxin component YwqK of YwqJK toxin-antitoxin module